MSNFDNFLADFARSGNRYTAALRLVMSGKASGMSAETIIDRAHGVGVTDRDADLRRLWTQSKIDPSRRSSSWRPSPPTPSPEELAERRRLLLPKSARQFVPVTLRGYSANSTSRHMTADAFAETIRMSEDAFLDAAGADIYPKQAARQLRSLFREGEKIWAGWIVQDETVRRRLGIRYAKTAFDGKAGIVEAHTLAARIESGIVEKIPTHISLNPVTGEAAKTSGAKPSFDCAATIADHRHVIVEWDDLFDLDADGMKTPSQAHIEIVAGLFDYADETDILRPICAVSTGGKSIHVALRVPSGDRDAYKRQTDALRDLFTSADDKTFRADPAGWDNGYTHLRLAGAIRPETGRRARLLWAKPGYFDRCATSEGGI